MEKRMGMDKQTVRTLNRLIDMKVDTEKKLTALTIQDILSMQGVTVSEIHIITELQDAVKKHKVISYLGHGTDDLPREKEKEDESYGQEGEDY